jgi:hypothetical protein
MLVKVLNNFEFEQFDQQEYDNIFYSCQNDHPFVVFTTCYCPLCENMKELEELTISLENISADLDTLTENNMQLIVRVNKTNPELLI